MTILRTCPIITVFLFTACSHELSAVEIKQELTNANYCDTADECVYIGSLCPFDCSIFANIVEAGRIRQLLKEFPVTHSTGGDNVQCIESRCEPILEPAPPPSSEEAAGNVGAACTSHEDCVTPMDYLVRSICPYTSYCVEGTCVVACPLMNDTPTVSTGSTLPVACTVDSDCSCDRYAPDNLESCSCIDGTCAAIVES